MLGCCRFGTMSFCHVPATALPLRRWELLQDSLVALVYVYLHATVLLFQARACSCNEQRAACHRRR
jgi:hypothetical protein